MSTEMRLPTTTTNTVVNMTMMQVEWGNAAVSILAGFIILFILMASIGNLLVMIAILISRHRCDRGYIFLFNLSVIDFLTALCAMPISLVTLLNGTFIYSNTVCEFNGFSVNAFFIANIHTLMYMAVYRYISISEPFSKQQTAVWKILAMIGASWVWAIVVTMLTWRFLNHFLYKQYTTQCGPDYPVDVKGWLNVVIVAGTCFLVPLIVVFCMYGLVFYKASKLYKRLQDPTYSNSTRKAHEEHRHLSITFIMVLVAFLACWTPLFSYLNYASYVKDKDSIPTLINPIVYWFSYMNSAVNPVIYGFRTPIFRNLWKKWHQKKQKCLTASDHSYDLAPTEAHIPKENNNATLDSSNKLSISYPAAEFSCENGSSLKTPA